MCTNTHRIIILNAESLGYSRLTAKKGLILSENVRLLQRRQHLYNLTLTSVSGDRVFWQEGIL